jgi:hypothetical protein
MSVITQSGTESTTDQTITQMILGRIGRMNDFAIGQVTGFLTGQVNNSSSGMRIAGQVAQKVEIIPSRRLLGAGKSEHAHTRESDRPSAGENRVSGPCGQTALKML